MENVLLTRELIIDIGKIGNPSNVVLKLDMAKVYDWVSLFFLIKVLREMRFSNTVVDVIWRMISNNYYFIFIGIQLTFFTLLWEINNEPTISCTLYFIC